MSLTVGIVALRAAPKAGTAAKKEAGNSGCPPSTRRGITLLEVLVVVAIVGLLIAILAPGIGAVRARARNAKDASNLRQHAAVMAQYVGDWRDDYPLFLDPSRPRSTLRWESRERVFEDTMYFLSCLAWPVALSDSYYDGTMAEDAFWSLNEPLPRAESSEWTLSVTSYYYPCAFLARPQYWSPSTRSADPATQTGATRGSEVRFPSSKALLVTTVLTLDRTGPGWPTEELESIGLCDGSAVRVTREEAVAATVFADGHWPMGEWSAHAGDWPRLMHTPDGVYGRDYIRR